MEVDNFLGTFLKKSFIEETDSVSKKRTESLEEIDEARKVREDPATLGPLGDLNFLLLKIEQSHFNCNRTTAIAEIDQNRILIKADRPNFELFINRFIFMGAYTILKDYFKEDGYIYL